MKMHPVKLADKFRQLQRQRDEAVKRGASTKEMAQHLLKLNWAFQDLLHSLPDYELERFDSETLRGFGKFEKELRQIEDRLHAIRLAKKDFI
jgi:hypothetical protein